MKKLTRHFYKLSALLIGVSLLFWRFTLPSRYWIAKEVQIGYGILLLLGLIVMAETDIRTREIPHPIQLYFLALGLLRLLYDWHNWRNYIAAFFFGGGFFLLISIVSKGKLGGGDIKLMALAGLCLGLRDVWVAIAIASGIAAIFGILLMVLGKIKRQSPIPFGPFLGIGIYLSYLFGWYLW